MNTASTRLSTRFDRSRDKRPADPLSLSLGDDVHVQMCRIAVEQIGEDLEVGNIREARHTSHIHRTASDIADRLAAWIARIEGRRAIAIEVAIEPGGRSRGP